MKLSDNFSNFDDFPYRKGFHSFRFNDKAMTGDVAKESIQHKLISSAKISESFYAILPQ